MGEQGLPQVTNSELIADLEAILLELRDRLNNYLDLGARDLIADRSIAAAKKQRSGSRGRARGPRDAI
jgi:hypothetical protein